MILTGEQAREVIWNDAEDWEEIKGTREISDTSRWSVHYTAVFAHGPSTKLYRFDWSQGATEQQDEQPFGYEDAYEPIEVVAQEVTVTKYVKAEQGKAKLDVWVKP